MFWLDPNPKKKVRIRIRIRIQTLLWVVRGSSCPFNFNFNGLPSSKNLLGLRIYFSFYSGGLTVKYQTLEEKNLMFFY
jgi:hypothetical protein